VQDKTKALDQGNAAKGGGGGTLLCRFMWMFIGPLILGSVVYQTVAQRDGWFVFRDIVFAIALALMIGARWLEIRTGAGETATGEPATVEHFKRYAMILVPVAAVVWTVAKVVGTHVLG
jgi:hypothetical protein